MVSRFNFWLALDILCFALLL